MFVGFSMQQRLFPGRKHQPVPLPCSNTIFAWQCYDWGVAVSPARHHSDSLLIPMLPQDRQHSQWELRPCTPQSTDGRNLSKKAALASFTRGCAKAGKQLMDSERLSTQTEASVTEQLPRLGSGPVLPRARQSQLALIVLLGLTAEGGGAAAGQAVPRARAQGALGLSAQPQGILRAHTGRGWLGVLPLADKLPQQGFLQGGLQAFTSPLVCAWLGVMQIQLQDHICLEGENKEHEVNGGIRLEAELSYAAASKEPWLLLCRLTAPCCGTMEQHCCQRKWAEHTHTAHCACRPQPWSLDFRTLLKSGHVGSHQLQQGAATASITPGVWARGAGAEKSL